MNDHSFDIPPIRVAPFGRGEERKAKSMEDGTVIDLQRYRILKTIRLVMNTL